MIFKAEAAVRKQALDEKNKAIQDAKVAVDKMDELNHRIENLEKDKQKAILLS